MKYGNADLKKSMKLAADDFEKRWVRDPTALGRILRCHLLLEHYLDQFLRESCPLVVKWDSARLSFAQKLALSDHHFSPVSLFSGGISSVNKIRNQIAHTLNPEITERLIQPMRADLSVYFREVAKTKKPKLPKDPLDLLECYTRCACSFLGGASKLIGHPAFQAVCAQGWEARRFAEIRPEKLTATD